MKNRWERHKAVTGDLSADGLQHDSCSHLAAVAILVHRTRQNSAKMQAVAAQGGTAITVANLCYHVCLQLHCIIRAAII